MDKLVGAIRSRLQANTGNQPAVTNFSSAGDPQQLTAAIAAGRQVRRAVDSLATAQHTAVQQLLKWASKEPNAAIRDVVHQISELDFMWLKSQTDFRADLADFEKTLSRIVDIEEQSQVCLSKAKKDAKTNLKTNRTLLANVQNGRVPETNPVDNDPMVLETLRENEVQKLLHLKKSLSNLSKAYVKLGEHCSIIFEAQQRIATLLPDAEASLSQCPQLSDVKYEGTEASRALVAAARAKLSKSKGTHNKKCTCNCGGRRHRSKSRVQRRCSEPVPYRPPESSEDEYEDEDDDAPEPPVAVLPPPYVYASAPVVEKVKDVTILSSKFEEVVSLSSSISQRQTLYPDIPVQTSTNWSLAAQMPPPPYLANQRFN